MATTFLYTNVEFMHIKLFILNETILKQFFNNIIFIKKIMNYKILL